jgi:BRCT domain type II-containing protein
MALEGTVAFTGRLASMRRADAFALVRTHGGKPREGVTKRTDVLIVGEFGWPFSTMAGHRTASPGRNPTAF